MKMMFVGGGSLGPVTPLIATAQALRRLAPGVQVVWVGTSQGPERAVVEAAGITFETLPVVKWPRHPTLAWIKTVGAWWQARQQAGKILERWQPDVVVSVGGFSAVPMMRAAARRPIPCVTHQLDVEPGLANRLVARLCVSVTSSFPYRHSPFGSFLIPEQIPTPVRFRAADLPAQSDAIQRFGLDPAKPVVLVFGGGQGARALNEMMERTRLQWLKFTQVIHVTGLGKGPMLANQPAQGYAVRASLDERAMRDAYAAAHLLVCRGGMGTLSEGIAALGKAAIVVPLPASHQEANARAFADQGAVILLAQTRPDFDEKLLAQAKRLLNDAEERLAMGVRAQTFFATDDGTTFAKRILNIS